MTPSRNDLIAPYLMLTLCMAMFAGTRDVAAAETEATTWEVEIDVFSGRPNPVYRLQDSEIVRVTELLSNARTASETKEKAKVFPSRLGYRGTSIRCVGKDKAVQSAIRVRGRIILEQSGQTQTWRNADDTALEHYLADLALQKGAISENIHHRIREAIEKASIEKD